MSPATGRKRRPARDTWWAVYRVGGEYLETRRAVSARRAARAVNERTGIPQEELVAHLSHHRGVHPINLGCLGDISHADEIDACLTLNSHICAQLTGGVR